MNRRVIDGLSVLCSALVVMSSARLAKTNLTVSQRPDPISCQAGGIIEFHRRAAGGFKSGEQWEVQGCLDGGVQVLKARKRCAKLFADQVNGFQHWS